MSGKVVTFGEIMLRLNPEGYLRLPQATKFEASYAGGEANVAVAIANYGGEAEYITKLPDNDVGQCAINELRRYGVETKRIVRGGPRLGIYFIEKGASQRPSKVIYDRAGSSIALAKRSDFDWYSILLEHPGSILLALLLRWVEKTLRSVWMLARLQRRWALRSVAT